MIKQIQWFPGHMFKSLREIREKLSLMDIVLVLLDARLPESSMNPELFKLIKNKPMLILLNKMDLADENELSKWITRFNQQGYKTL
ncbi:MAG: ribosome biogenesis GTPase YlqF, partial [Bacillota bacterium]